MSSVLRKAGGVAVGAALFALAASALAAPVVVRLTPAQEKLLGVSLATLRPAAQSPLATLPATFVRPPAGRSAVSAPFEGTLVQVLVVEGQRVAANQVLGTVFSRSALDETAELRQADAEASVAAAAAARTRQLVQEGIVAGARQAEAEAREKAARAIAQAKAQSVRSAAIGASGRYSLRSPFSGRVASAPVGPGEGVAAMSTVFVVDREDRIQVEAMMPASLAGRVVEGARAVVEGVEGRVIAVGAVIDPKTRSLTVRAEAPPQPGFIPGKPTRLDLYADGQGGLTAPRAALTTIGGRTVAFVRSAAGYTPQPVQVLGYSGDTAVIAGPGLRAGARVAVTGVSELKARSAR